MEVFTAKGYRRRVGRCCGDCGPEFAADAIVVANTRAEALGLLLEAYSESTVSDWAVCAVDTTKLGVTEI